MKRAVPVAVSREEAVAWSAFMLLPVLVPIVLGVLPFASTPFAQNPAVYPKTVVLALLVTVASAAVAYGVGRGTIRLRTVPGRTLLAVLFGLAVLSTVFALSPQWALFGGEFLRVGLLPMALCGWVYVLATQLVTSTRRMRELAWATVAGGIVVAVVAFLQTRGVDFLATSRENMVIFLRGPSLLGNPDYTATYLVVVAVLAAGLALSESKTAARVVAWICCGFVLLTIALSLTRGAWVGSAVGVIALLVSAARARRTRRAAAIALGGAIVVVAVAVAIAGPATFAKRFEDLASASTAGDTRLLMWSEALSVAADRPLLGTGPDSYSLGWYAARSAASMEQTGVNATHGDPHNVVLLLVATLGVPAGLLATGLVLASLWSARRAAFDRDPKPAMTLYAGWWSAALGLSAALLFAPSVVTLVMMLALVLGVLQAVRATPVEAVSARSGYVLAGVALASAVLLVFSAITLLADVRMKTALDAADLAGIDAAAATAPWHAEAQYVATYAHVTTALATPQGAANAEQALDEAGRRLDALVASNPHKYGSLALKAYFLLQRGARSGSTVYLEQGRLTARAALAVYPRSPVAATYVAQADAALGDTGAALATLEPIWKSDPAYTEAGVLYVRLLVQEGRTAEAVSAYEALLAKHPWDPAVLEVRATLDGIAAP